MNPLQFVGVKLSCTSSITFRPKHGLGIQWSYLPQSVRFDPLTFSERGPSLDVRICSRQILTSKDVRLAERIKIFIRPIT